MAEPMSAPLSQSVIVNSALPPSQIPDNLDGASVRGLLNGSTTVGPHEFIYYWREHELYAIRMGPWKAHFITRAGFGNDAPVVQDPPLLFNVEFDPAEAVRADRMTRR
jgi:arylsulfatase A